MRENMRENMKELTWREVEYLCFADYYDFYIVDFPIYSIRPAENFQQVMVHHEHGGHFEMDKSKYNEVIPGIIEKVMNSSHDTATTVTMPIETYQSMVAMCEEYKKLKNALNELVKTTDHVKQNMVLPAVIE